MKILVFEDSPAKMESLQELINVKLNHEFGKSLSLLIRIDDHFWRVIWLPMNFQWY